MEVITAGRIDLKDLISISGIFGYGQLNHTPFLVFVTNGDRVEVEIVDKPKDLLMHSDDTPVMVQWAGQWRSDFFQFKVGDVRPVIEDVVKRRETAKYARSRERGM
jgi:hypothetical protein